MRIKSYLSYSQYSLFNKSKEEYKRVYIDGIKTTNKYFEFGTKISDGLEHRQKKTKDKDVILARKLIKSPKEREKNVKVVYGEVPLFGILDGYNKNEIEEYKTGTAKWTQKMADQSEQLTLYAILISESLKIPVGDIKIILKWLPTFIDINGEIHLTGEIKEFETKRIQTDLIRIYPKIRRTWLEIEKFINQIIK